MKEIISNQSVIYLLARSPCGIYVFIFAKVDQIWRKFIRNVQVCHCTPPNSRQFNCHFSSVLSAV